MAPLMANRVAYKLSLESAKELKGIRGMRQQQHCPDWRSRIRKGIERRLFSRSEIGDLGSSARIRKGIESQGAEEQAPVPEGLESAKELKATA